MASTILGRLSQPTIPDTTNQEINSLASQIMGSANPQQTFNSILENNPNAKQAMDLINQYGNGDPKAAFMNYMSAQGKQAIGNQIIQKLGLH